MKLLFCTECEDIIRLKTGNLKKCDCGRISGRYIDEINAVYSGPAYPIGIDNNYFAQAIRCYPHIPDENSMTITASLIPKKTDSLKKLENNGW